MSARKIYNYFRFLNWNTLRFNFHYFDFWEALKLPVHIHSAFKFKNLKGTVKIETQTSFGMIKIGFGNVGIFDSKTSPALWDVKGIVVFKGNSFLGQGAKISVGTNGTAIFGDNFYLTAESSIIAHKSITCGCNNLLSWDVLIMDTDFHQILDEKESQINPDKEINIGNNVWIGCRTTILKGSKINDNTVIAANSSIFGSLEKNNCIYGGFPVKILKENISWRR